MENMICFFRTIINVVLYIRFLYFSNYSHNSTDITRHINILYLFDVPATLVRPVKATMINYTACVKLQEVLEKPVI
jgi:hypothetical protein